MNRIDHKFLYYKTKTGFDREKHRISPDSIVFILDLLLIWTHNNFFGINTGAEKAKGFFSTLLDLRVKYPVPAIGDWAIIGSDGSSENDNWKIATCETPGTWKLSDITYRQNVEDLSQFVKKDEIDLSKYALTSDLQEYLKISDLNLSNYFTKNEALSQINNIVSSVHIDVDDALSNQSENPVQNKVVTEELLKKIEASDLEDYAKLQDVRSLVNNRIDEILQALEENEGDYNIREEIINEKIQQLNDLIADINKKYISWYSGNHDDISDLDDPNIPDYTPDHGASSFKFITLSDEDYQSLVENGTVDEDTYYFTYSKEDYPDIWGFGGKFPITFNDIWTFGGTFPITIN